MSIDPVSLALYENDFAGFAEALFASFRRYGFAVVSDHDLPPVLTEGALAHAKAFFALPEGVKRAYHVAGGGGQRGFTPFGIETAKAASHHDLKEFWHVGRDLPEDHPFSDRMPANLWPREVEAFREDVGGLYAAMDELGRRILQAVAHGLGLEREFFEAGVAEGNSILRLLHYPAAPFDGPSIRAAAHEDINVITLLLGAEEAGLEILDRDGRWLAVNPPPGAVVCNIGDMLQRLTNHVLPSTTHRVANPAPERRGAARYSMPFFLHFAPDYRIETLAGCIEADRPDLYPQAITADAFLRERLREIRLV